MVKTIFNRKLKEILDNYPKLLLRMNYEFEKLGLKSVKERETINEYNCEKDLTLVINPLIQSPFNTWFVLVDKKLENFLKSKKGYYSLSGYYTYNFENRIKIETVIDNEAFEIGCYLKERNIILIYYPIFRSDLSLGEDNEILFWFLTQLKDWFKANKPKVINNKKLIREMILERFMQEAKKSINEKKASVTSRHSEIENYQSGILNSLKLIEVSEAQIKGLTDLMNNSKKRIDEEMKDIETLPFVKKISLTLQGISVDVGEISILYNGHLIKIGEFKINLRPDSISMENKTPLGDGDTEEPMHHPHINSPTDICFGSRATKVYELLSKFELKKLVYFLYLFLRSYNPKDKYYDISYWAKKQEIKLEEEENDS